MESKPPRKLVLSLRARALGYLARREHSRHELSQKLARHAQPDEVEAVLADFEQRGWLNEARFAEQFVHSRLSRFGPRRIQHDLSLHQLPESLNSESFQAAREGEFERALTLYRLKFVDSPTWLSRTQDLEGVDLLSSNDYHDVSRQNHLLARQEQAKQRAKDYAKRYRFLIQRGFTPAVVQKVIKVA